MATKKSTSKRAGGRASTVHAAGTEPTVAAVKREAAPREAVRHTPTPIDAEAPLTMVVRGRRQEARREQSRQALQESLAAAKKDR